MRSRGGCTTACEGPDRNTYPYGKTENDKACNTKGANPINRMFGHAPSKRAFLAFPLNHPLLNQFPGTVAPTGSFEKCESAYGIHDMVGNVHEWTADKAGAFHGGYYRDTHENGDGCHYVTTAHAPSYHDYSTGFRCCRDAE